MIIKLIFFIIKDYLEINQVKINKRYLIFLYIAELFVRYTMKKLIFCCLCVLALMACGEHNAVAGRWAMEMEGSNDTAFLMPNDSICAPELRFFNDTIYLEVQVDGEIARNDFVGIYSIKNDEIRIVGRLGEERLCRYKIIDGDTMLISYLSEPDKIVMRLRKIKED